MNNHFAKSIEQWYAENRRDLPWRNTSDPYLIWVSEIILQQTRVAQGYDYFLRFVGRFPTVESLASASEDEVLLLWQGLGYYSRARNMHKAAKAVVERGSFPSSFAELRSLPGVGEYTAAAIASFAYEEPCAVLDGNVYRVLSRYLGVETPIDSTQGKHEFRALADEMLDASHPALYNQAIMDFGALVCTPHTSCQDCLLCETCVAFRTGRVKELPQKSRSLKVQTRHLIYIYVRVGDRILLHRRGMGDIWANMFEPPLFEDADSPAYNTLRQCGKFTLLCKGVRHQLTHRLLIADFYLLECDGEARIPVSLLEENGFFWIEESERDAYATSRLVLELYKKMN